MIGKTLSHYRILEKVGAGGMGEVYRAHDERLDRDVALKVLPAGLLADEVARKRFHKEALALSKLNHPSIQTVHDFDTQAGVDFLVTEYVPGGTVRDRLTGGALPEKEIAQLGAQLAEALEEAHEQGVIHRDLKPGNIKVTPRGHVKVLDFGLARLLQPCSESVVTETLTETQAAVGTLPYMAPEQLRGKQVDARTDLYALGTILYEMATGRRPFQETLSTALVDAILHQPPPPPGRLQPDLSPRLEEIILKCLEKEPERRYQSAKELLVDLRRLGAPAAAPAAPVRPAARQRALRVALVTAALIVLAVAGYLARQRFWPQATPPAGKIMLAVLPFENLSGDPEQEYFSDGMTEETIAQLGRLQPERLGVIARTSAMHYKGTDKRIDEIGRELSVDYILEGSVRRDAGRVRITVQLIQVRDQTHLWADNYERELAGILVVQSDVAQRVAQSLALKLLPAGQAQLTRARPVTPEAHELYLKGQYHYNKWTEEGFERAIEYFQKAVEADPSYAPAHAGLAFCYGWLGWLGQLSPKEAYARLLPPLERALEFDSTLPEAHLVLANAKYYYGWDWAGAEAEYQRTLELNPSLAAAHYWYALFLNGMGRHAEAIAEAQRGLELDPLSVSANIALGQVYHLARQYNRAIAQWQQTIELEPNDPRAYDNLVLVYEETGMYEEAVRAREKAMTLSGARPEEVMGLARAYGGSGAKDYWRWRLERLKPLPAPYSAAVVYVRLGDNEQALVWLGKAYEQRDLKMVLLKASAAWDPLRSDPRFQDLLQRMNFPE